MDLIDGDELGNRGGNGGAREDAREGERRGKRVEWDAAGAGERVMRVLAMGARRPRVGAAAWVPRHCGDRKRKGNLQKNPSCLKVQLQTGPAGF